MLSSSRWAGSVLLLFCVVSVGAHNVPMSEEMPVPEPVAKSPQSKLHRFHGLREQLNAKKLAQRKAHTEAHDLYLQTDDHSHLREFHSRRRGSGSALTELTAENFQDKIGDGSYWFVQFHTGEVTGLVNSYGSGGSFQKAAEEFAGVEDNSVKFATMNAKLFPEFNHKYHHKGEGKYPVFRIFGPRMETDSGKFSTGVSTRSGRYLCHTQNHKHAVEWVDQALNVVRWDGCSAPASTPPPRNDSPAVLSEDYKRFAGMNADKYMKKLKRSSQSLGEDLMDVSDEL
jgi:hypothetical protein